MKTNSQDSCPVLASALLCPVWLCSVLLCSAMSCFALFCYVLFCSILLCSVLLCSVLLCSVLFSHSLPLSSVIKSYPAISFPLRPMFILFLVLTPTQPTRVLLDLRILIVFRGPGNPDLNRREVLERICPRCQRRKWSNNDIVCFRSSPSGRRSVFRQRF